MSLRALPFRPNATLTAPVVEGSMLQTLGPDPLLFSTPSDPNTRAATAIRRSDDPGVTWEKVYPYETITLHRVPIARLAG